MHDLGDSISLGLAWYFDRMAKRGSTPKDTYGYARYSLLRGLITAFVLVAGIGFILWNAGKRLLDPEDVDAPGMIILSPGEATLIKTQVIELIGDGAFEYIAIDIDTQEDDIDENIGTCDEIRQASRG